MEESRERITGHFGSIVLSCGIEEQVISSLDDLLPTEGAIGCT